MNRTSRPIAIAAAAIAALIAAELFLQATQSRTLLMGLWYSPGIHTPSERFGFVFTPHYSGVMQHPDGVLAVPLSLDEHGFRKPVVNRPTGPYAEVLFVGGMSMMFSYGLPDDESLPAQAAHAVQYPVRVRNTAWPGFNVFRNYHAAQDLLGEGFPGDVVVLGIYWLDGLQADTSLRPPKERVSFRYFDDLVVRPQGEAPKILGSLFYRSFLAYSVGRWADRTIPARWLMALRGSGPPPSERRSTEEPVPFREFVELAVKEIRRGGAEPLVAFLPVNTTYAYDNRYDIVPRDVRWVDLHEELARTGISITTIAGHYSADTARAAGRILGREIDALLEMRSATPSH